MQPAQTPAVAGIDTFALNKRQHRAFVNARLMLVSAFIGLWPLMLLLGLALPVGFLAALVVEAGTLSGYGWLVRRVRSSRSLDRLHYLLLTAEIGFHSAMVYYLGGVSWLGPIAYIYAVLYAGAFLSRWQTVIFTAAVSTAAVTMMFLDGAGIIPHQWFLPQGPDRYQDPRFLATSAIMFVGVMGTVAFWVAWLGSEVRRERDEALRANAELVTVQAQLRALNEELERKVEERTEALLRRAETDQLTGLLNRGAITRRFRELLALAQRGGRPLTVVLADGDNFKACNDLGGHPHGDRILQFLARGLAEKSRETDYIGRMGGDEFLMLLPDTSALGAVKLCRRVAQYIEKKKDRAWEGLPVPTLSFGIAVFPNCGSDADDLIRSADQAMYEAKREGGNRWRFSGGASEEEEPAVSGAKA
jgi:diguanylate cyclase (GGDEF)-like protein